MHCSQTKTNESVHKRSFDSPINTYMSLLRQNFKLFDFLLKVKPFAVFLLRKSFPADSFTEDFFALPSICISLSTTEKVYIYQFSFVSFPRVFKKTSQNGKITLYLANRDLMVTAGKVDKLQGVILVDPEVLQGKKVSASTSTTQRKTCSYVCFAFVK